MSITHPGDISLKTGMKPQMDADFVARKIFRGEAVGTAGGRTLGAGKWGVCVARPQPNSSLAEDFCDAAPLVRLAFQRVAICECRQCHCS